MDFVRPRFSPKHLELTTLIRDCSHPGGPIAFIGNMNNNFFSIVRHMRDRGHDARLLCIDREQSHFLPHTDCLDDDYLRYTSSIAWGGEGSIWSAKPGDVRRDLVPYSQIIGCGAIPALMAKAGLRLDLIIPYGDDLYLLPFSQHRSLKKAAKQLVRGAPWKFQRQGISEASWIQQTNVFSGERAARLSRLGISQKIFYTPIPMVYDYFSEVGSDHPVWRDAFLQRVREVRGQSDFLVLHHNRHLWTDKSDLFSRKGNDVFLRGYAQFCGSRDGPARPIAVLLEYGAEVEDSKRLIQELGIADRVVWLPRAERRLILLTLSLADVGIGQFTTGIYLNGVVQEVLASGSPLIHNYHEDRHSNVGLSAYPYVEADSPEAIARGLQDLWQDPERRKQLGSDARHWYRNEVIGRALREYEARLELRD